MKTGANLGPDRPKNHAKGCCCFRCDPGEEKTKRALERARERAEQAKRFAATTGLAPRPSVVRPPSPAPRIETNQDRKFRKLLASGVGAAAAIAQIDAEENERGHHDDNHHAD